jgi:hypothetical protein
MTEALESETHETTETFTDPEQFWGVPDLLSVGLSSVNPLLAISF